MTVVRTPQQQLDTHQAVIEAMQAIADTLKNPSSIKESAKLVIDANTISDEKRKELEAAEKIIAESKISKENVAKEISLHHSQIDADKEDIARQLKEISDKEKSLDSERVAFENERSSKIAEISRLQATAENRHKEADEREKIISERENSHANATKILKSQQDDCNKRVIMLEKAEAKMAEEQKKLTAKKNKIKSAIDEE